MNIHRVLVLAAVCLLGADDVMSGNWCGDHLRTVKNTLENLKDQNLRINFTKKSISCTQVFDSIILSHEEFEIVPAPSYMDCVWPFFKQQRELRELVANAL